MIQGYKNNLSASGAGTAGVDRWLILLILAVAAVLRLIHLGDLSLSNDELSAMTRARFDTFLEMYRSGAFLDGHPAGVQVFLYYWMKWFGDDVFIVRLPFALFSLGSVYLVYRVGKQWFHASAGLLAAAFLATFEFPLLYSVLARSYSPGLFLSLLTVYGWSLLVLGIRKEHRFMRKAWLIFGFSLLLGVHTHYFAVVLMIQVCISGFFLIPHKYWSGYLLICSSGILSFLPELPFLMDLLQVGGLGNWLGAPQKDFLVGFFHGVFNGSWFLAATLTIVVLIASLLDKSAVQWKLGRALFLSWFAFSYLLAHLYSLFVQPILQPSTLFFTFPLILLVLFSFWPVRGSSNRWKLLPAGLMLLVGTYSTVIANGFYRHPPFGVFKDVAEDLSAWNKEHCRLAAVVNVVNPDYIGYYFRRNPDAPSRIWYKVESTAELAQLREQVDTCTTDYFAYCWTNNFHPYEIAPIIRRSYPFIVQEAHYFNAESWLFSKKEGVAPAAPVQQWLLDYNDTTLSGFSIIYDTAAFTPPGIMAFRQGVDYAPAIQDRVPADALGYAVLHASVWYRSSDTTGDQVMAMAFEADGRSVWWESVRLNDYNLHPGQWQQAFLSKPLPAGYDSLDIKVYIWNSQGRDFSVDNLQADLRLAVDPYLRK